MKIAITDHSDEFYLVQLQFDREDLLKTEHPVEQLKRIANLFKRSSDSPVNLDGAPVLSPSGLADYMIMNLLVSKQREVFV